MTASAILFLLCAFGAFLLLTGRGLLVWPSAREHSIAVALLLLVGAGLAGAVWLTTVAA